MARRTDPLRDADQLIERVYAYVAYRIGASPRLKTSPARFSNVLSDIGGRTM